MEINVASAAEKTVLSLAGTLDFDSSPALKDRIRKILQDNPGTLHLTLNVSNVRFIDSSGVATMIDSCRRMRARNGRFVVTGLTEFARGLFEILNLQPFLEVVDEQAV